jgi:hypothetical protein
VNDFYKDNYKLLGKRSKQTTEAGKFSHAHDRQNQHSKNGYTIKCNQHVQYNSHQNPNDIHHRDCKINPNVHLEAENSQPQIAETILSKKNNTEDTTIPDFKLYYKP